MSLSRIFWLVGWRGLSVVSERDDQLVLEGRRLWISTRVEFMRRARLVRIDGRLVRRFDDISSIAIVREFGQEDEERWYIDLSSTRVPDINLGRLCSEVDASVVAARISTITGAKVRVL